MVKPNFFLTAAALHLGMLAFSYWFSQNRRDENKSEDEKDSSCSQPSATGNTTNDERGAICGVCFKVIESNPITVLICGHKVHERCFDEMKKDNLTCPTCFRERNNG